MVTAAANHTTLSYRRRSTSLAATVTTTKDAGALSVDIKGDTFLAALGISPARMLADVAALDAAFFGFVLAGIGLLYWTMPAALVVRPPRGSGGEGGSSRRGRRR